MPIDLKGNRMGVGVIICNALGAVVAASCSIVPFIIDLAVAKAVALWRAVTLCGERAMQRIHFKGDANEIVQALQSQGPCWSWYGHLIEATRTRLQVFQHWLVTHSRRETNEATHWLAKTLLNHSMNFV